MLVRASSLEASRQAAFSLDTRVVFHVPLTELRRRVATNDGPSGDILGHA